MSAIAPDPFAAPAPGAAAGAAELPRFVKVLRRAPNGLVVFEFSIGWPDLSVELVLPQAAFDEFVQTQRATLLDAVAPDAAPVPIQGHGDAA